MCAACCKFKTNWACPPAMGELDELREQFAHYERCIVVQTIGEIEDSFDVEGMQAVEGVHKRRMNKLAHLLDVKHIDALVLSAGTCAICPECTYPENPCRYPDKQMVSVEAAGIVVTELCQLAGLPYYYGSDKIAYIGCVLVERKENVD